MGINIGDISGCLEVIGDCSESSVEIQEIIKMMAEREWNLFSEWYRWGYSGSFKTYYHLDVSETKAYDTHSKMPETFVSKYIKKDDYSYELGKIPKLLYHKKKPDTFGDLRMAFDKSELYKIKCKTCGRIFLMDEISFKCVKWHSCIGAECFKRTIDEQTVDYTKSGYVWSSNSTVSQILDNQLAAVEEVSNPLTYYGQSTRSDCLKIAYISDIHLEHHLKYYDKDENRMIKDIVSKLYRTMYNASIIIFDGDTSSNTKLTMKFYYAFMQRYDYISFLKFKSRILKMKQKKKFFKRMDNTRLKYKFDKLNDIIKSGMENLEYYFDFSRFIKYHDAYYCNMDYEDTFECYKKVKSYKNLNVPQKVEDMIVALVKVYDFKCKCEVDLVSYKELYDNLLLEIQSFEELYGKNIEEINATDYRHYRFPKDVFVVLGNHEYFDFEDVASGVLFYKSELAKIGITLLHNNSYVYEKFMIYGGTGFAKYDEKWNADTIKCCPNFSREDEKRETELFEKGYKSALAYAKENNLCFLCVSHYPIAACLDNKFDKKAIYFTGHNHQNRYIKNAERVMYADNQIGYRNNNITFRIATTGFEINPYADVQDGLYVTTIKDYLQFYRYIGENIGKGEILYQRCQNGKANLYVIKRKEYYGFFIMPPQGSSKGISIVNGGVTKKLTNSTDMSCICEKFDIVLSKYLQILTPLRNAQEQLSKELKDLGLSGEIHGCIVDIDFCHHIMLNPVDGSITFYYSPEFGRVLTLDSFDDVMKSIEKHNSIWFTIDCVSIRKKYIKRSRDKKYLLRVVSNSYLLDSEVNTSEIEEQIVGRADGMYGISRRVNPLQRLFSGHVLRDFDLRLAETWQEAYRI